jgi:hypothetical protein
LFATGVAFTGGKFAAGVVAICLRYQQHYSETGAKIVAGVVDTCGKFATGFVDTGGAP